MVFSLFKIFTKVAPKVVKVTPKPAVKNIPKPQTQQSQVIGSFGKKPIVSVRTPIKTAVKDTASPKTVVSFRSSTVKQPPIRRASTVSVQSTASIGGNILKTKPAVFNSPIIQETGLGITFKTNRPIQRVEGTGKKLFGDFGIPIRPDNAILIRPKNPAQTRQLVNQFRRIQNTNELRSIVQGTAVQAVRISDVRNLRLGGNRLKDIATVSSAKGKTLQKGDIVFRRVGQDPKDEFTFGAIGDTFFIDKTIPNPKPFLTSVEPRPELLQRFSKTGINKEDPVGELIKARTDLKEIQERIAEIRSTPQFKNLLGKGSELGVQDTASRGGRILDSNRTFDALNSIRGQKGFDNFTSAEQQRFLKIISENPSDQNVNFVAKLVATRDPDPFTRGFMSKTILTPEQEAINNARFVQVQSAKQTLAKQTEVKELRSRLLKLTGSELGVQDTSARGKNILGETINIPDTISLGAGSAKIRTAPINDVIFGTQVKRLFNQRFTPNEKVQILGQAGLDPKIARNFVAENPKASIRDIRNQFGNEIVADIENVAFARVKPDVVPLASTNKLTLRDPPEVQALREASGLRGKNEISKIGLTARQRDQVTSSRETLKDLGLITRPETPQKQLETGFRNIFANDESSIFLKKVKPQTAFQFDSEITFFGAGKNIRTSGTFGAGLSDIISSAGKVRKTKRLRENRDQLNFGDIDDFII